MEPLAGRGAAERGPGAPGGLAEALAHFDAVAEELSGRGEERPGRREEIVRRRKQRRSSGPDGERRAASADLLDANSSDLRDEQLNSPALSAPTAASSVVATHKAKLGDTKELEDFIADLDRTLAKTL
ncbi:regulator of cell cycle RGCC [Paroedura picta]|uniref:regulator of cell cycle RGCC n=1 Tax=Paroedura picta TaxID=143630 RepID=UPI004055E0EE